MEVVTDCNNKYSRCRKRQEGRQCERQSGKDRVGDNMKNITVGNSVQAGQETLGNDMKETKASKQTGKREIRKRQEGNQCRYDRQDKKD